MIEDTIDSEGNVLGTAYTPQAKDMFEFQSKPPIKKGDKLRSIRNGLIQYWVVERRRKNKVWVKLDIKNGVKGEIE